MAFIPAVAVGIGAAFSGATAAATGIAGSAAFLGATAAVGAGLSAASLLSQPKIPKIGTTPGAPNATDSLLKAKNDTDARRATALKSGGLVNPTGGGGSLLGAASVDKKKLFGE